MDMLDMVSVSNHINLFYCNEYKSMIGKCMIKYT